MRKIYLLLLLITFLSGCMNYPVPRYSVSVDNVVALKARQLTKKISVGNFSSYQPDLKVMVCRGFGPIKTPDGEVFSEYIRKAITDELKMSDAYSPESPIQISGRLNNLSFTSTSGYWDISLTVNSSNGHTITVDDKYKYETDWQGDNACNQTSLALLPAVQRVIGKVLSSDNLTNLTK